MSSVESEEPGIATDRFPKAEAGNGRSAGPGSGERCPKIARDGLKIPKSSKKARLPPPRRRCTGSTGEDKHVWARTCSGPDSGRALVSKPPTSENDTRRGVSEGTLWRGDWFVRRYSCGETLRSRLSVVEAWSSSERRVVVNDHAGSRAPVRAAGGVMGAGLGRRVVSGVSGIV